eukprot:TRINITY_DN33861_c0_g1_i1.p1 TRINITY_DN33861_c0_g1~~TRINITY_DN33861_c0_g1_i1.p1  ORF type:complete len:499 (+),score=58.21 TRINITY_DN33861_c0_g1_i1:97-1497(+)
MLSCLDMSGLDPSFLQKMTALVEEEQRRQGIRPRGHDAPITPAAVYSGRPPGGSSSRLGVAARETGAFGRRQPQPAMDALELLQAAHRVISNQDRRCPAGPGMIRTGSLPSLKEAAPQPQLCPQEPAASRRLASGQLDVRTPSVELGQQKLASIGGFASQEQSKCAQPWAAPWTPAIDMTQQKVLPACATGNAPEVSPSSNSQPWAAPWEPCAEPMQLPPVTSSTSSAPTPAAADTVAPKVSLGEQTPFDPGVSRGAFNAKARTTCPLDGDSRFLPSPPLPPPAGTQRSSEPWAAPWSPTVATCQEEPLPRHDTAAGAGRRNNAGIAPWSGIRSWDDAAPVPPTSVRGTFAGNPLLESKWSPFPGIGPPRKPPEQADVKPQVNTLKGGDRSACPAHPSSSGCIAGDTKRDFVSPSLQSLPPRARGCPLQTLPSLHVPSSPPRRKEVPQHQVGPVAAVPALAMRGPK